MAVPSIEVSPTTNVKLAAPSLDVSRPQQNPISKSNEELLTRVGADQGMRIQGSSLDGDTSFDINPEVSRL